MVYRDIASWLMPIFERRRQKKSAFPAFLLLLMLLIAAGFIVWKVFYTPTGVSPETTLSAPAESAVQVRLNGSENFVEIPGIDKLLEQEEARTRRGTATLTFFDGTEVKMDEGARVVLERVRERDNDNSVDVVLHIAEGRVWASVPRMINPNSAFILRNNAFEAKIRGGEVSFGQNKIAVAAGSALVTVPGTAFESEVELGQEITLTEEVAAAIRQGATEGPEKTLISADFQESPWFIRHTVQTPPGTMVNDTLLSSENGIEGEGGAETEAVPAAEDDDAPAITLTAPGKNGETVTVADSRISITGTVPERVEKVMVNNYTLKAFRPGDTEFRYNAAVEWGTLEQGENEYRVVAVGEGGERYTADITIVYGEDAAVEAEDEPVADEPAETDEPPVEAEVTGELTITSPENGDEVDDAVVEITGTAPSNAVRIIVDDYTLQAFQPGDKTWLYRMSDAFDNREVGEQTIVVEAVDASGSVIATEEVTFTVGPAPESEPASEDEGTETGRPTGETDAEDDEEAAGADGGPAPADRSDERGVTLPPGYDSSSGPSI